MNQPESTTAQTVVGEQSDVIAIVEAAHEDLQLIYQAIDKTIFGQRSVIEQVLITLLADGHALLVGVPGLAKTRLVETIGTVTGLDQRRIQFTPDLMPSDIIGSEVMEEKDGIKSFRYLKGPVFSQLLMADEINRASPRTQSALLQAMQEYHVTVAGQPYKLPRPFHVLATQNPLEQEGTYPLPEAQLDRFLMQIDIGYPDLSTEKKIIVSTTSGEAEESVSVITAERLLAMQKLVRKMPLSDLIVEAIVKLVRCARPDTANTKVKKFIAWGPGPRASQALALCVRARALVQGRLAPAIEDIVALAPSILQHRMALTYAGRAEGLTVSSLIAELVEEIS